MTTTTASLIERYVAATVARTPHKQRDDVEADLRAAIADAVDATLDSGEFDDQPDPASAATEAVLTRMGDPEKLAADYADRPLVLIGPRLFLQWKRLTTLLIAIVVPLVAVAAALAGYLDGDGAWVTLGTAVGAAWGTTILIGFWVTLVFAVLERASDKEVESMTSEWTLDRLEQTPQARVSMWDTVGACVTLLLTGAFIVWQNTAPWEIGGVSVPVINPDLWSFVLPALLVVMAVELFTVIFRQARGRWTMPDWWGCLALNLAWLALLAPSMLGGSFFNAPFFDAIGWPDSAFTPGLEGLGVITYAVLVVFAGIDVVAGWRKARQP